MDTFVLKILNYRPAAKRENYDRTKAEAQNKRRHLHRLLDWESNARTVEHGSRLPRSALTHRELWPAEHKVCARACVNVCKFPSSPADRLAFNKKTYCKNTITTVVKVN